MKTLVSYYDKTTGITLTLCHFPKWDGPIENLYPFVEKETIENGNKVFHVDYVKYLQDRNEKMMKYILKNSRMEFIDFSK